MVSPVNFPNAANNVPPVKISGDEKSEGKNKSNKQIEMPADVLYIPPPVSFEFIQKTPLIDTERYNDPKLNRTDIELAEKYIAADDKEPVKKLIRNRLIMYYSEMLNKYTGREDTEKISEKYYAFVDLIAPLDIFSEEESYEIVLECVKSDLIVMDQMLIDDLMKDPNSENAKNAVLGRMRAYNYEFQGTILGSAYRIRLFRAMTAFNALASYSGITDEEILRNTSLDRDQLPEGPELTDMLELYVAINTQEKSNIRTYQDMAVEYLKGSMRDFFSYLDTEHPSLGSIFRLSARYAMYEDIAVQLGVAPEKLVSIENEVKGRFKVRSGKRKGDTDIFSPDDLPKGVKDLLKRTELRKGYSYFQFVKDNCEHIIISKDRYTSESINALIGGRPGGQQVADGTIYVNMVPEDMKDSALSEDIVLYNIILHEVHHLYNRKTYFVSDQKKLQSVWNESSTYGFEAEALKKLDTKGLTGKQVKELKDAISIAEAMSKAADAIYDKKDIENAAFGLRDLGIYPSNTPYIKAYAFADNLKRSGMIKENEMQYFISVFSQIILDKLSIEDAPGRVKDVFNALLDKIPDLDRFTWHEGKLIAYNYMLSDSYGLEKLQCMIQYSADYVLDKSMVTAVHLLDDKGKPLGIVPKDAKIKLLMADAITINDTTYVRVTTSGMTGYLAPDSLVSASQ